MINEQRWFTLSLAQQMGHIGSEIARARIWENKKDIPTRNNCLERAMELIDLTKNDPRLHRRRKELCYLKETVADQYIDSKVYDVSLEHMDEYCTRFLSMANNT